MISWSLIFCLFVSVWKRSCPVQQHLLPIPKEGIRYSFCCVMTTHTLTLLLVSLYTLIPLWPFSTSPPFHILQYNSVWKVTFWNYCCYVQWTHYIFLWKILRHIDIFFSSEFFFSLLYPKDSAFLENSLNLHIFKKISMFTINVKQGSEMNGKQNINYLARGKISAGKVLAA